MPIDATRPLVRSFIALSAVLAGACGGGGGDGPTGGGSGVAEVRLTQRTVSMSSINDSVRLVAGAYDENNSLMTGVTFSWRSLTPAVASVLDANGLVRAQANGVSKVVVTGGGKTDTATVTVHQQTSSVLPSVANAALEVGDTLYLTAVLRDARGVTIAGRSVAWTTENESVVTINAAGMVVARAIGSTNVVATGDGRTATIPITVAGAIGPFIDAISPDTIVPGATLTITGRELNANGAPAVTINGVGAGITSSSATQIVLQVPSATQLGCTPTQAAPLAVTTGARTRTRLHPMKTAARRTLAVGESITMLDANSVKCNELVGAGRYIMSVFNTSSSLSSTTGLRVRGAVATTMAATLSPSVSLADRVVSPPILPSLHIDEAQLKTDRDHFTHLEWTRRFVREAGSPIRQWQKVREGRARDSRNAAGGPSLSVATMPPAVGDTLTIKYHYNSCSAFTNVRARVVYIGTRSIVLEDVAAPAAGAANAELIGMGQEFDNVQYPILVRDFGNPLALDGTLNADGRIYMLFTPQVAQTNALAFVSPCDFFPASTFAASNQAEIFYARTPTTTADVQNWRFGMRSTVIHEMKHVTAMAERLSRYGLADPILEESWLEEGLARLSEEQFSRTFANGGSWKGNVGFAGMECELRRCDSRPYMMTKHFDALYDNFRYSDSLTFLGPVGTDATFYGSGWAMARWAIDNFAGDEASFIRALVNGPETGVNNIAARTGLTYPEIVADYSLAMFLDDYPGFVAARASLKLPSWNLRAVMGGMNAISAQVNGNPWPIAFPLAARLGPNGNFTSDVSALRSGRAAFFDITIAGTGVPQMLELQSTSGGPPAANVRVSLVRVQ